MSTTTVGAGIPGLSGGRPREAARAAIDRYTASGGEGEGLLSLAGRCVGHAAREVLGGAVDDARLVASVEGWHRLEAAVHAEKLRRIAALAARQGWVGQAPNPARMLVDLLGVTPGEARLLVDAAEMLERMPQVAARLAAGELSAGHVAELTRTVGELKRLHGDEGGDGEGAGGESAGGEGAGGEGAAGEGAAGEVAGGGGDGDAGEGAAGDGARAAKHSDGDGALGCGVGGDGGAGDRLSEAVASLDDLVGGMGADGGDDHRKGGGCAGTVGCGGGACGGGNGCGGSGGCDDGGGCAGGETCSGGHGAGAGCAGGPTAPGDGDGEGASRAVGDGARAGEGGSSGGGGRPVGRQALRRRLREWEQGNSPELLAERERRQRARRSLWVGPRPGDPDGMGGISGDLDAVTTAKAQQVVHALARKRSVGDRRTFRQRCHDAFGLLLDLAIASGKLPDVAGDQPRVLLVAGPDTLHGLAGAPPATLDGYGPVSAATARQMCCDAEVAVVVTGEHGSVLNVGRDRRQPNRAQRRAVFARDRGCVGCGASLSRCQIHHRHWWSRGGATDIDNLLAVCWDCHANIHHCGWQVTRQPDGAFRVKPPSRPPGDPPGVQSGDPPGDQSGDPRGDWPGDPPGQPPGRGADPGQATGSGGRTGGGSCQPPPRQPDLSFGGDLDARGQPGGGNAGGRPCRGNGPDKDESDGGTDGDINGRPCGDALAGGRWRERLAG